MTSGSQPAPTILISTAGVRKEIWRSLISMLRVYASLEGLGRGEAATVEESGMNVVVVEQGGRRLTLSMEAGSGLGRWMLPLSAGEFTISETGSLEVDHTPRELDAAAIEWLDKLGKRPG